MTVRDDIDRYCDCVNGGDQRPRQQALVGRGHRRRRPDAKVHVANLGFELADMGTLANAPLVESGATLWITLAYRPGPGPIRSVHGGFRNRLQSRRIANCPPPSRVASPIIGWRTPRPSFAGASERGRKTTCK